MVILATSAQMSHRGMFYLSTVAASEQNENRPWCDGGAQLPLVLAEGLLPMALKFTRNILCGIVAGLQRGHYGN